MSFMDKVLDYPVLVQGVLGSFLFWILYELGKRLTNLALKLAGQFSNRVNKEIKLGRFFHHAHSALEGHKQLEAFLSSIFVAINRIIHAALFALLGASAGYFVGAISVMAYLIAIFYLYLALRAVHVNFGPAQPQEFHTKEMSRLANEITQSRSSENNDKNV